MNKRVVALLAIVGAAVIILAVILFINRLPKDINAIQRIVQRGDDAMAKNDLPEAEKAYAIAIGEAGKSGGKEMADLAASCRIKWAKVQFEWIKSPMVPPSERMERYRKAKDSLGAAMRLDPKAIEAQRLLTDVTWSQEILPMFQLANAPWDSYRKEAQRLLALEPRNHVVWYRLALADSRIAEIQQGTYQQEAVDAYRKAIELKGDEADYWIALARHEQRFNQAAEAPEKVYQEAIEKNPNLSALRVTYAEYLLTKGEERRSDALEELKEATNRDPRNILGRLALGRYYISMDQLPQATRLFEEAREIDPLDTRPYRELAALYARRHDGEKALAILRSGLDALAATTQPATTPATTATTTPATDQAPPDPVRIEASRAELSLALAGYLLDMGDANPSEMAKYIEQAKECLPRFEIQIPPGAAKIKGRIAFSEGRFDDAGKLLEPLVREPFFDPQAAYLLMHIYRVQRFPGKADKLVEDFTRKVPGAENYPMLRVLKAQIKMDYHQYEDAAKEVDSALRVQPDNPQALEMRKLLRIISTLTIPDEVNLTPQARMTLLDRINMLWQEDRHEEATRLAEALYARYPEDLSVVRELVLIYAQDKKIDEAKGVLNKAIEKYPDNQDLKAWRGQLGENDPAKLMAVRLAALDAITDPLTKNIEKAEACMTFGDANLAARFVNEAAAIDPNNLRVIDLQFRLVMAMKEPNWEMAQDCARRAGTKDSTLGHVYAARIAMRQGDAELPAAIEELTAALRDKQEDKQARVMLGECYMRQGKWLDAEKEFKQVATVDPGYAQALKGMAIVTENLNNPRESAQWVEKAYRLIPLDPYIRKRYIDSQDENLDPAAAIKKREEWRKSHEEDGQNILRLAFLYEKVRRFDDARAAYEWLTDHAKDSGTYLFGARQLLLFLHRQGKPEDVNTLLSKVVNFDANKMSAGDKTGAMLLQGDIYAIQGTKDSMDAAQRAYKAAADNAASVNPKDTRPYAAMMQFYAAQGKWVEAAGEQRKVIELAPPEARIVNEKVLAGLLINGGQYLEAGQCLERVLSSVPDDPEALADKAVMLLRSQGQLPKALEILNSAVQANPGLADPLIRRAMLLAIKGDVEKAKADLITARTKTANAEVLRQIGGLFQRIQAFEQAEDVYRDVLSRQEDYRPVLGDLLSLYLNRRNWERFDMQMPQALRLYPKYVPFLLLQAKSYELRKLNDKRIEPLEAAIRVSQEPRVLYEYWVALLDNGKADKVLETTEKYLGDKPVPATAGSAGPLDYRAYRVMVLSVRARAKLQQKKASEADDLFKSALKEATAPEVSFVLDQAEKAYGVKEVIVKMEGWTSLRPNEWFYLAKLGEFYAKTKDPQSVAKALALFNKALDLAKEPLNKAQIEASLGMTYHQSGKADESEQHYLASLKDLPDNPNCLNNLAYLYADLKNAPDKALPYAEKAAKLLPEDPNILDTVGWIYVKLARYEQGETALLRAVRVENSSPVCRYHLGYLYEKLGRLDEALKHYKIVVEVTGSDKEDPTYKLAVEGRDRVQIRLWNQPATRSGT
ncbi:MAG: tetratricopeptide repeat protein [Phycisphaerae bacterium]